MSHQFKVGDLVIFNGLQATIITTWYNYSGERQARILFSDKAITPNEKDVSCLQLQKYSASNMWYSDYIDTPKYIGTPKTYCQKCGDKWRVMEHPIFGKKVMWYDCTKCNTKREDYYKESV